MYQNIQLVRILTIILVFLKALSLNLINKLAGGLLSIIIMLMIASTLIWFAEKSGFVSGGMKDSSISYPYLSSLAPIVIDYFGQIVPIFKDLFRDLDILFQKEEPVITA